MFQFAALLIDGELSALERYDDVDNPAIQCLLAEMEVDFEAGRSIRYARVEVTTKDGRELVAEDDEFTYEPGRHRTILESEADAILPHKIERAIELINDLENVDDVAELTRPVSRYDPSLAEEYNPENISPQRK